MPNVGSTQKADQALVWKPTVVVWSVLPLGFKRWLSKGAPQSCLFKVETFWDMFEEKLFREPIHVETGFGKATASWSHQGAGDPALAQVAHAWAHLLDLGVDRYRPMPRARLFF